EPLIGFTHRNLSGRKSNLAIGEGCLTSLEVEPPIRHLLGENAVRLREIGELGSQCAKTRRRGFQFLGEPMLPVQRNLETRLRLRLFDLIASPKLAGFFLRALGVDKAHACCRNLSP